MKMLNIVAILIGLTFSVCAEADNVKVVKQGDQVEQDGFWVSREQMKEFVKLDMENKNLKEQVVTLKDLISQHELKTEYYKKETARLESELSWSESKGYLKTGGGFLVGVIAMSIAVFANNSLSP